MNCRCATDPSVKDVCCWANVIHKSPFLPRTYCCCSRETLPLQHYYIGVRLSTATLHFFICHRSFLRSPVKQQQCALQLYFCLLLNLRMALLQRLTRREWEVMWQAQPFNNSHEKKKKSNNIHVLSKWTHTESQQLLAFCTNLFWGLLDKRYGLFYVRAITYI